MSTYEKTFFLGCSFVEKDVGQSKCLMLIVDDQMAAGALFGGRKRSEELFL